jgi:hypothetical protein
MLRKMLHAIGHTWLFYLIHLPSTQTGKPTIAWSLGGTKHYRSEMKPFYSRKLMHAAFKNLDV